MNAPGGAGPLLEVERLRIEFPGADRAAVRDLSFRIDAGEIVGVVGPSGSGKSLTALALIGLVPAPAHVGAAGLRFAGRDLTNATERDWRSVRGAEIGMAFQEPLSALNPVLTLGDQIGEVARAHRGLGRAQARRRALDLLGRLALDDPERTLDSFPHQLSGGQRQRAMLAVALAAGPRLLIADEPTTALDPLLAVEILDLFADLRERLGLSVLLITHDVAAAERRADRILRLEAGDRIDSPVRPEVGAR